MEMFTDIVDRYIHMGANQFLRDFRRTWEVQKSIAHRNMVMVRKEKKKQKDAKVPIPQICGDSSANKVESHRKLQGLIANFGTEILSSVYTRADLVKLCKAYGVHVTSRKKKADLGADLAAAIAENTCIPHCGVLSSAETSRIRIRILRVEVITIG